MIQGLDHIAIAVPDLDKAIEEWTQKTDAILTHREHVRDQDANVAFLLLGSLRLELIAPDKPESAVGRFLHKRGPGLHHIALKSENGQRLLDDLIARGARLIDKKLRNGAEGTKVGFVHPASFGGVLIEVVELSER